MATSELVLPADPRGNYLAHKDEIDRAIQRVLEGGHYILGEEVAAFEREFARYLGLGHTIGVGSGTDALHLALRVLGIGPGNAVITVSHTAVATVAAIELAGATPVLVDIDPETFTMDPGRLEEMIKKHEAGSRALPGARLKAVIPVHLYGHPADMPAILRLARAHDLYVVEDCAQSHGASLAGQRAGTWGHVGAFSFYPTKNLGALGDGGALVTNDSSLAERARLLREYGWRERYISDLPGMNTRLDELQAAVLRVKLQHLDGENGRRRQIARIYDSLLAHTTLTLPISRHTVDHVYHQYVVQSKKRDDLKHFLNSHSIGTAVHYPAPVHLQPAYRGRIMIGPGNLKHTETLYQEILSLPMHPHMADGDAHRVCDVIQRWHAEQADLA